MRSSQCLLEARHAVAIQAVNQPCKLNMQPAGRQPLCCIPHPAQGSRHKDSGSLHRRWSAVTGTGEHTASACGSTATEAVDVCRRPAVSVTGTRCTLCTPLSHLSWPYAPSPVTAALHCFTPPTEACDISSICMAAQAKRDQLTCSRQQFHSNTTMRINLHISTSCTCL